MSNYSRLKEIKSILLNILENFPVPASVSGSSSSVHGKRRRHEVGGGTRAYNIHLHLNVKAAVLPNILRNTALL